MVHSLRIAIVCPEFRTDVGGEGGLATSVDFVRKTASDRGWEAEVFSPRMSRRAQESRQLFRPATWFRRLTLHRREDGVTTVGAHLAEFEPVRYLPRRVLDTALEQFDVVVIVAGSPAAATIARRTSTPVVLAAASLVSVERVRALSEARGPAKALMSTTTRVVATMDRRAVRIPANVLVLNQWMKRICLEAGAKSVTVAPPGVDTEVFVPPTKYSSDGPLVMVARLGDPRKDYPTLFRAYAGARARGLTAPLVVAGRGHLSPSDRAVLGALRLSSHVTVHSDLSETALLTLLQSASLFVMSSAEEGLGLSIIEAMACGLPVISTSTEGAQYVLGASPAGELVPVGDPDELARALIQWTEDSVRREEASSHARARAVDLFSLEATGKVFAAAIEAVVDPPGRPR